MSFDVRVRQKSLGKVTELVGQNSLAFDGSEHQDMAEGSCLHHPNNPQIKEYAQYAAANSDLSTPPSNDKDPDTPEQAVRNLTHCAYDEFYREDTNEERVPDRVLLNRRHGDIGKCRHYADLTIGLLRSLGLSSRVIGALMARTDKLSRIKGHFWTETYVDGRWRHVDTYANAVFNKGVYSNSNYKITQAWANNYPLSSAGCVPGNCG
jgi:transglutaminase-like putative cysteine protease